MSRWCSAIPLFVLVVGGSPACATKNFVKAQVKAVNDKVETLSRSVEDTQERTRRNEGTIGDLDLKAQAAQGTADQARQAAGAADVNARAAGVKAAAADAKAFAASAQAADVEKASRRLVYAVVLSEDQGQFRFAETALPEEAKARIDELVDRLKADPRGVYFEIEGHTDSVGSKWVNERVGLDRAEAVKRYLFEAHQIPLHKINVISYGLEKPLTSNKTKDGRAQNRRVVIRVLA
jgi:outer membrane protein OmpA-like peptidoglycan-associated protein